MALEIDDLESNHVVDNDDGDMMTMSERVVVVCIVEGRRKKGRDRPQTEIDYGRSESRSFDRSWLQCIKRQDFAA